MNIWDLGKRARAALCGAASSSVDGWSEYGEEAGGGGGEGVARPPAPRQLTRKALERVGDTSGPLPDDLFFDFGLEGVAELSDREVLQLAALEADVTPTSLANRDVEITNGDTEGPPKFSPHTTSFSVFLNLETIMALVVDHLLDGCSLTEDPASYFEERGGTQFYEKRWVGPHGLTLLSGMKMAGKGRVKEDSVHVVIHGSTADALGPHRLHRLWRHLEDIGARWNLTRCDGAFDGVKFSPFRFYLAIMRGDIRTRVKLAQHGKQVEDGGKKKIVSRRGFWMNEHGHTAYLGSRSSDVYGRCYNMRGYNRYELEVKGLAAKSLQQQLVRTSVDEWPTVFLGFARRLADFVDRAADSNVSRCPMLKWWAEFVGDVARAKVSALEVVKKRVETATQKVVEAGREMKRMSKKLAVVGGACGSEAVLAIVKEAMSLLDGDSLLRERVRDLRAAVDSIMETCEIPSLRAALDPERVLRAQFGRVV